VKSVQVQHMHPCAAGGHILLPAVNVDTPHMVYAGEVSKCVSDNKIVSLLKNRVENLQTQNSAHDCVQTLFACALVKWRSAK